MNIYICIHTAFNENSKVLTDRQHIALNLIHEHLYNKGAFNTGTH